MDSEPGTDTPQSTAPGTLERFHLGLAADGTTCAMVFVDDHHRSIACIASFADLHGFIVSLTRAANELARRRAELPGNAPSDDQGQDEQDQDDQDQDMVMTGAPSDDGSSGLLTIASSDFRLCAADGSLVGTLVTDDGRALPVRLRPGAAHEMARNVLKATRASAC